MSVKTALVTGGASGLGYEFAVLLAQDSHNLILIDIDSNKLSETKKELESKYSIKVTTLTKYLSIQNISEEIFEEIDEIPIDVLINNAGIALMNHLVFTPLGKAEDIFKTNFLGTFLLTREVVKIMTKKKFGRIINFSSVAVPLSIEGEAVYASSKAAIETFTKIAAREVSEFNITVNALAPTPIKTDLIRTLPKDKITKLISQQAIKRLGTFKDVSNVVDFFIKKESDFITGQIVYLGGV